MTICKLCKEEHAPDRGLSFDGCGINLCDQYRTRFATINWRGSTVSPPALHELAEAMQHAPELVAFVHRCAAWKDGKHVTGSFDNPGLASDARALLATIGISGPPAAAASPDPYLAGIMARDK